jgi:hypothetical protein
VSPPTDGAGGGAWALARCIDCGIRVERRKCVTSRQFTYRHLKMAAIPLRSGIIHFVFKICETKKATRRKARQTEPSPGICYFGADAARVVWMDETDTVYDGQDAGPFYSREWLDADIAAADLVLAAIHSPQVMTSPKRPDDTELNEALRHVHAAVHLHTEPRQDWLRWIFDRLAEAPALPQLNSRRTPKKLHRGVGKAQSRKCACTRKEFVEKLCDGLKFQEQKALWHDHRKNHH